MSGAVAETTSDPSSEPRRSLRARLALWIAVPFGALFWLAMAVFWVHEERAIDDIFDTRAATRARWIAQRIAPHVPHTDRDGLRSIMTAEFRFAPELRFEFDILDAQGRSVSPGGASLVAARPDLDPLRLGEPVAVRRTNFEFAGTGRLEPARAAAAHAVGSDGATYSVVLVVDDAQAQQRRSALRRNLVLIGIAGSLCAVVGGWVLAGVAVAPLRRLRGVAATLYEGGAVSVPDRSIEVARLARELESARDKFVAELQAQSAFLANVSHELRTPIAVILTESQTLDRSQLPEETRAFLDSVRDEMLRLGRVLESFLMLTRIQEGKGLARSVIQPANDLVMDAVAACALMARQYGIRVEPHLLCADETIHASVNGEPELLTTMVVNLIRNAIQFSPPAGRVDVAAHCPGEHIEITVSDRGPGIPEERLANIFDRFSIAGQGSRRGRSHGLGLSIAQGIARLHGGEIRAVNRAGGGSEFVVRLPVAARAVGLVDVEGSTGTCSQS